MSKSKFHFSSDQFSVAFKFWHPTRLTLEKWPKNLNFSISSTRKMIWEETTFCCLMAASSRLSSLTRLSESNRLPKQALLRTDPKQRLLPVLRSSPYSKMLRDRLWKILQMKILMKSYETVKEQPISLQGKTRSSQVLGLPRKFRLFRLK